MRKIFSLMLMLVMAVSSTSVMAWTSYETEKSYTCSHPQPWSIKISGIWYEQLNGNEHIHHQAYSHYCENCLYEMSIEYISDVMPHNYEGGSSCMLCGYTNSASDNIKVVVNGSYVNFDVPPQIINGRTMVPVRAIFEALGADVYWDDATKTVYAEKPESDWVTYVKLTIGSNIMEGSYVGNSYWLESPATIIDGRTLVPARAAAEGFGHIVEWDESTRTVYIGY